MSDVIIKIVPPKALSFTATDMLIRVIGGDPVAGTSDIYFEIFQPPIPVPPIAPENPFFINGTAQFNIRGNATVETERLDEVASEGEIATITFTRFLQDLGVIPK